MNNKKENKRQETREEGGHDEWEVGRNISQYSLLCETRKEQDKNRKEQDKIQGKNKTRNRKTTRLNCLSIHKAYNKTIKAWL